jgi:hypothetical protein
VDAGDFVEQGAGGIGGGAGEHVGDVAHVRQLGRDVRMVEVNVDAVLPGCCHRREDATIE